MEKEELIDFISFLYDESHGLNETAAKILNECIVWRKRYIDSFGTIISEDRDTRIYNIFCSDPKPICDPEKRLEEVVSTFTTSDKEAVEAFLLLLKTPKPKE